jgi:tRNA(fMet)-specific endonuclease VapC
MTYLLDTNVCIRYLNGQSEAIRRRLESTPPHEIVLCSVVKAELFYGVDKSKHVNRNLTRLRRFLAPFASLPFDDTAAEIYGRIRAQLETTGTLIGPNDLLIAAISIANGATLVTHNTQEFGRIEGLELEDWEAE